MYMSNKKLSKSQKIDAQNFKISHNHYGIEEFPLELLGKSQDSDSEDEFGNPKDTEENDDEPLDPAVSEIFSHLNES